TRTAGRRRLWRAASPSRQRRPEPTEGVRRGARARSLRSTDRGAARHGLPARSSVAREMGRKTPLYDRHTALGARIVAFAGWDMPLDYGSQIEEHHTVRR